MHAAFEIIKEDSSMVILNVDASNAFNAVDRMMLRKEILNRCPVWFNYFNFIYSTHRRTKKYFFEKSMVVGRFTQNFKSVRKKIFFGSSCL